MGLPVNVKMRRAHAWLPTVTVTVTVTSVSLWWAPKCFPMGNSYVQIAASTHAESPGLYPGFCTYVWSYAQLHIHRDRVQG